jgi:DNA-binding CsgD family transcriptional regulator
MAAALEEPDAEIAAQLEQAAELARSRGAPSVAAELGEAAARATAPGQEEDRRRRIVRAARDHVASGSAERGFVLANAFLEHARPGPVRAEALALLAHLEGMIDVSTAVDRFREALHEPDIPRELELELHVHLALSLRITEGMRAAERHARLAVELAERQGSDVLGARALATLAIIRFNQGDPGSFALAERAAALARRSGDALAIHEATSTLGHCFLWSGRIDEARHAFEANFRAAAGRDEPTEAETLWYLALVEERAGRLTLAREHAERSRELMFQYAGHDLEEPGAHLPLARVAAYLGDVELARELGERAYAYAKARGGMSTGRVNLALLGSLDHWAGEPARALERFEAFDEQRRAASLTTAMPIHIADHVEALLEVGRAADAVALLDLWESDARTLGHRRAIAEVVRCRGLVAANSGDVPAAIALLEKAVAQHEDVGDPFGRARALFLLGLTRRRARQKRAAREAIETALAGFEAIGAAGWAGKARAELGSIGGRTREDGLTPAERRVAALVAEGRTNREVAAALFLGERTVETHLSHVYAKLGIRSRTELARVLR